MLAKLLTALCLVALAACIDDEPFPILHSKGIYPTKYITVSSRVQSPDTHLFHGPRYYIPNGECLGYLDPARLCGNEQIKGIEVKVTDPLDFAVIKIHPKRGVARIMRRGLPKSGTLLYCPGAALVDVRLTCDHWKFSHSHSRARLPRIDSDSDSSDSNENNDVDDEAASQ